MERNRRVYPAQQSRDGWLSYLLLFLSALIILSGLVFREEGSTLSIKLASTPTPIPLEEAFDETPCEKELELPSGNWYALQLGAFESEEAARKLGQEYARRGAAGYVWLDGRYRTLAAVYPLKEDAQAVRSQLSLIHEVDTYLYEISLPALRIRLSGMKGQLEILEAAFLHANDLITSLQAMSVALDRQETNVPEALDSLHALRDQLSIISLRLRQRFASPRHQAVTGLLECFDSFIAFADSFPENENEVMIATRLKQQTLDSLDLLHKVYQTLSNT